MPQPAKPSAVSMHFQADVNTREEADAILSATPNSFMVRKSSWGDDCVALSSNNDGNLEHFVLKFENGVWVDDGSKKSGKSVDMLLAQIWPDLALRNTGKCSVREVRRSQYGSISNAAPKMQSQYSALPSGPAGGAAKPAAPSNVFNGQAYGACSQCSDCTQYSRRRDGAAECGMCSCAVLKHAKV